MASPLTLFLPVIPGTNLETLNEALGKSQAALFEGLTAVGTVHYARILLLDANTPNLQPTGNPNDSYILAVITEFDGSFDAYIQDFINQMAPVFDALLGFVVGGPALIPVTENVSAFIAYSAQNDASQHQPTGLPIFYQAYTATVQEILASLPAGASAPSSAPPSGS
jgi:hypothetical protein